MLEKSFSQWILSNRLVVIVLTLLIVAAAASGLRHLSLSTDSRVYFGPDNPQLLAFNQLEATFVETNNIFYVFDVTEGEVFTNSMLSAVDEVTETAWQTPYSYRVDSIVNYQYTRAEGDDLWVAALVEDPGSLTAEQLTDIRQIALTDPFIARRLISDDGKVTGVNVSLQYPKGSRNAVMEAVTFSRDLVTKIEAQYPGLKVHLTGSSMINANFAESALRDARTLVPTMYLFIIVVLMILLRSVLAVIVVVLVNIMSTASAMGMAGWIGIKLTPMSISSSNVIMTVVVAHCVHVLVTFFQHYEAGDDRIETMKESVRVNLQPVFLTSITTIVGFLSLNLSDVPPMGDFGNIVACGVFFAMLFALGFLPALASMLPIKVRKNHNALAAGMDRLADFVISRRTPLFWGILVLAAVVASFAWQNQVNDRYSKYFSEQLDFRVASDFADDNLAGLYSIEYILESGAEQGVVDPGYLQTVESFAQWLRQQEEVRHVSTFTDIMKRLNKNMHGDSEDYYTLPESRELASQYLLLYEMSLPYGLDLTTMVNQSKSATRLTVSLPSLYTQEFIAFQNRAYQWLQENAPETMHYEGASMALMFTHIGKRAMIGSIKGAVVALVIISFILLLALRSVRLGLISLLPNLLPAAVGFGVWGILSGKIGLSLASVLGITMGIVVDDTVHFLSKYKRAREELGANAEEAVRYAFRHVGVALWVTTLVLTVGFFILSLSWFKPTGDVGALTAIVISIALFLDFLLLPPLLIKIDRARKGVT